MQVDYDEVPASIKINSKSTKTYYQIRSKKQNATGRKLKFVKNHLKSQKSEELQSSIYGRKTIQD